MSKRGSAKASRSREKRSHRRSRPANHPARLRQLCTRLVGVSGLFGVAMVVYVLTGWAVDRRDEITPAPPDNADNTPKRMITLNEGVPESISPVELTQSRRPLSPIEELAQKQDVIVDDWDTERLSERSVEQLSHLQTLLSQPGRVESGAVVSLITDDFSCQALRPDKLSETYRQGAITVRDAALRGRAQASLSDEDRLGGSQLPRRSTAPMEHWGASGFANTLNQLKTALGTGTDRRVKFKLFQIDRRPDGWVTRLLLEAQNRTASESRQQVAMWLCQWTVLRGEQSPRLSRIELEAYEEAHIAIPGGQLFVDCTQSVFANSAAYRQHVVPGINHWLTRIPREFLGPFGHHGIAVGDVNGDGLDDLYVCDAGGLPNRLYHQQADGSVVDHSARSGVDLLEDSVGALLIDLDNDGDQDLIVGTDPVVQLAENDGHGRFTWHASLEVETDSFSLCAADYDVDGDLDIYVCGYNVRKQDPTHRGLPFPLPYHDANNGGRNLLLRNDGNFRFADVTQQTGLDANNTRFSMAATWEDFDNDGDLDLYVANDFGRNNLYRNDGGYFTDIAMLAGVEDHATGMSASWGDYNRDGWMDLYVGNMFSAAGNRVSYQRRFSEGVPNRTVSFLRRMARGNTLFANATTARGPEFHDLSRQAGVTMGRWAWGSKFIDLTNDGWQDLVVANGYVTGDDADDL